MRNTLVVLMLGSTMAMLPVGARAHHSFQAEYDGSQPTDYVGIISRVDQQNPHGFIYVDVPPTSPGGRVTNWALETPGPNQLVRNGFTREMYEAMVEQGEEVTVRGYPARDGSKHDPHPRRWPYRHHDQRGRRGRQCGPGPTSGRCHG
jgi:hypothetical protein